MAAAMARGSRPPQICLTTPPPHLLHSHSETLVTPHLEEGAHFEQSASHAAASSSSSPSSSSVVDPAGGLTAHRGFEAVTSRGLHPPAPPGSPSLHRDFGTVAPVGASRGVQRRSEKITDIDVIM